MVYWVKVVESSGAGSPLGCLLSGCCCCNVGLCCYAAWLFGKASNAVLANDILVSTGIAFQWK